ncbi:MAG: arsenate reductase ArsC [Pseudolysinimonas sp.]
MPAASRAHVTIDQESALGTSIARLAREFDNLFGLEIVERFVRTSYDDLAAAATVPNYLPLLTEKFARQRLRALARVEGLEVDGLPTVLFLCVHNAGRSQMALGFFQHYAGDAAVGWSGGSVPGTVVDPVAIAAMRERDIDISGEYPKHWTDEVVRAADAVITMGCGDACPIFPGKRYEEWTLPDPAGWTLEQARPVRDEIEKRVLNLLDELNVPGRI